MASLLISDSCRAAMKNTVHGNLARVVVLLQCCNFMFLCVQTRGPEDAEIPLKHQLLQIIVRVLQYRMLLTGNSRNHENAQRSLLHNYFSKMESE